MTFGALTKVQEKRSKGLLLLWAFERFAGALARLGLTVHVSVIYSERAAAAEPPELRLTGYSVGFATLADLGEVAEIEGYTIPLKDLQKRMADGADCLVLRHNGRIVACTWSRYANPPPRLGLMLGPRDAYLFDAYTAPSCRGRNVLPFLRARLYDELASRGRTNLLSSTVAFNRPAHRFKRKLGAQPLRICLYLSLFGRFERVFTLFRFPQR